MTAIPPQVHPAGRYNAKQTSELLGISRKTLQRWVKQGLIRQRISRTTTLPRYAGSDILRLWKAEI